MLDDTATTATGNENSSITYFSFKYTESGGITSRYLLISFDSKTKILTSSTDVSGANLSQKPLSDSEENDLKGAITKNEFFKTKTDYPPEEEDSKYISYNLTVTMNDNAHTTGWTDGSKGTPDGIMKIVNEIKKVSSNEGLV
jgi:hypothetical protein